MMFSKEQFLKYCALCAKGVSRLADPTTTNSSTTRKIILKKSEVNDFWDAISYITGVDFVNTELCFIGDSRQEADTDIIYNLYVEAERNTKKLIRQIEHDRCNQVYTLTTSNGDINKRGNEKRVSKKYAQSNTDDWET